MRGPLRYPLWKAAVGTTAGWAAWGAVRLLLLLPDHRLARVFHLAKRAMHGAGGDTPLVRSLTDLESIFSHGGPHAEIYRRLLTHSRAEEITTVVRGTVIRWLS